MSTKIFIIGLPSMKGMMEEIGSLIENAFDKPQKPKKSEPKQMKVNKPCMGINPWGVSGTPADENLKFGAAFEVDEPRSQDYTSRWEFEDDHEAFDRFVEAGEDCVARGLARPEGVVAHKCNAIRKPIGCPPPMGLHLIGETDWWSTEPCMWGL